MRIDDLELVYLYCDKVYCDLQSGVKEVSPDEKEKWTKFRITME